MRNCGRPDRRALVPVRRSSGTAQLGVRFPTDTVVVHVCLRAGHARLMHYSLPMLLSPVRRQREEGGGAVPTRPSPAAWRP